MLLWANALAATEAPHVRGELVSAVKAIAPGDEFTVLFRQEIDPGWHTYWINPGDSGAAPEINWTRPEGVTVGEFAFPYPERIPYGPLMNFGYHDEVLLPFTVSVAADFEGESLTIVGDGRVLVCADICIPEKMQLSLSLPVGRTVEDDDVASLVALASARIPVPVSVPTDLTQQGESLWLDIGLPSVKGNRLKRVEYFPFTPDVIDNAAEQSFSLNADGLQLVLVSGFDFTPDADLSGVLVIHEAVGDGVTAAYEIRTDKSAIAGDEVVSEDAIGLIGAVLFAFLGGLILNLMPCVFPVLSIKILSLAQSVHSHPAEMRGHGLAYALGVVLSFVAIALALILLRAGGEAIGWGFQLQSPVVVSLLAYLFVVIGLNLLGVFELGLVLTSDGDDAESGGYLGSVATGVLATLVAAPCTAPFMGAAVGFALLQSTTTALVIFAALGIGMALPYVVLCYSPGLLTQLPRPGNWMVVFRQFLAFPMFASAIWLIWVLGVQAGETAMMQVLAGSLLVAFAIWLTGQGPSMLMRFAAVVLIAGAVYVAANQKVRVREPVAELSDSMSAGVYSEAALRDAVGRGPVFVNFTAAWCITCKVNELNALESSAVREAFRTHGVTYLKADWTNEDPAITRALQAYGRSGVPLYLLYPTGATRGLVLPQLLTPGIVTSALVNMDIGR